MIRGDKDPTLDNMTNVDWDDPALSSLLAATQALRVDKRGAYGERAAHLRMGGGGPEHPALLVGEADGVLRVLFDQPLALGRIVSLNRDPGAVLGGGWQACSVLTCRGGARQEDAQRAIYLIELQLQRSTGT